MSEVNPYATPKADVDDIGAAAAEDHERLKRLASGQKLIIYSLLLSLSSIALQVVIGPLAGLIGLGSSFLAIFGAVRLVGGLGRGLLAKILYGISMLIPLINVLCMVVLSLQATKSLRDNGIKVGFFGATVQ